MAVFFAEWSLPLGQLFRWWALADACATDDMPALSANTPDGPSAASASFPLGRCRTQLRAGPSDSLFMPYPQTSVLYLRNVKYAIASARPCRRSNESSSALTSVDSARSSVGRAADHAVLVSSSIRRCWSGIVAPPSNQDGPPPGLKYTSTNVMDV